MIPDRQAFRLDDKCFIGTKRCAFIDIRKVQSVYIFKVL